MREMDGKLYWIHPDNESNKYLVMEENSVDAMKHCTPRHEPCPCCLIACQQLHHLHPARPQQPRAHPHPHPQLGLWEWVSVDRATRRYRCMRVNVCIIVTIGAAVVVVEEQ